MYCVDGSMLGGTITNASLTPPSQHASINPIHACTLYTWHVRGCEIHWLHVYEVHACTVSMEACWGGGLSPMHPLPRPSQHASINTIHACTSYTWLVRGCKIHWLHVYKVHACTVWMEACWGGTVTNASLTLPLPTCIYQHYMHVPRTHGVLGGVRCTGYMCTRYMHVQC